MKYKFQNDKCKALSRDLANKLIKEEAVFWKLRDVLKPK